MPPNPGLSGPDIRTTPDGEKNRDRQSYLLLPILNILVPQVGQIPCVAGLPFFMVISLGSFISLLALHFTQ